VFDLRPPANDAIPCIEGDATDPDAIREAVRGMDVVVYMAMVPLEHLHSVPLNYDINLKGLHLLLEAACDEGITRVVHVGTGSVFDATLMPHHDDLPHNALSVYGMTKGLAERVCEWYCRRRNISIISLRLWLPLSHEMREQIVERQDGLSMWLSLATRDVDVARAVQLAIDCPAKGFHAVLICGDIDQNHVRTDKARDLLGWEPTPWEDDSEL